MQVGRGARDNLNAPLLGPTWAGGDESPGGISPGNQSPAGGRGASSIHAAASFLPLARPPSYNMAGLTGASEEVQALRDGTHRFAYLLYYISSYRLADLQIQNILQKQNHVGIWISKVDYLHNISIRSKYREKNLLFTNGRKHEIKVFLCYWKHLQFSQRSMKILRFFNSQIIQNNFFLLLQFHCTLLYSTQSYIRQCPQTREWNTGRTNFAIPRKRNNNTKIMLAIDL